MFLLRLFGGVSLEDAEGAVSGKAARRHPLALLTILALSHPRRVSRDKLLGYLWPESASDRARNLLNQAVHALRQAMGRGTILSERDELGMAPTVVDCDVWAFRDAIASGDWERAVGLYAGPVGDGFFVERAAEFARWLENERGHLRREYLSALERLAETAAARGDRDGAVLWWRRLASEEAANARVVLSLMQALEAVGDRAGAIRQSEAHASLLREEFDAAPSPAVLALAERIRVEPTAAAWMRTGTRSAAGRGAHAPRDPRTRHGRAPSGRFPTIPFGRVWNRRIVAGAAIVLIAVSALLASSGFEREGPDISRLAVLPLANFMGGAQSEYFVDGLHDALVTELSRVDDLTVISRQSTLRYRDSEQAVPEIAEELGVDALVEGSAFRAGDSLRITVQLIRANPEGHLWAGTFWGSLRNALRLQGDVARAITRAVGATVAPTVAVASATPPVPEPDALDAYLRGLYYLQQHANEMTSDPERPDALPTAIAYLEQAVALDSTWAAPLAKLALAYLYVASDGAGEREAEFFPRAMATARRALVREEANAQAHAVLGFALLHHEWDWAGAEREIRRAVELEPDAHRQAYAIYLSAAGRFDEAIAQYRRAEERNPLSGTIKLQAAIVYSCAGRHDQAMAKLVQIRDMQGGRSVPLLDLYVGYAFLAQSMYTDAIAELEAAVARSGGDAMTVAGLAYAYARAGRIPDARGLSAAGEYQSVEGLWPGPATFAVLGDTVRAVDMVEAAIERERSAGPHFRCTWAYRELRDEPRISALVRRIGYPGDSLATTPARPFGG